MKWWRQRTSEREEPSGREREGPSRWQHEREYLRFVRLYTYRRGYVFFSYAEFVKDLVVSILYKRRGKFARPFLHSMLMSVIFVGVTFGPLLVSEATAEQTAAPGLPSAVFRTATGQTPLSTQQSEEVLRFRGGEVVEHVVQEGDTLVSIAQKYNITLETLLWENDFQSDMKIKPGDRLRILPSDGVRHKVVKGETIYTIAKKYGLGDDEVAAQAIINYPFNTFANDETFALTIGQYVFVPGGIKPKATTVARSVIRQTTPNAGAVSATGQFVWPASGMISQGYQWYHKAYDIANRGGGKILAADAGKIVVAGWVDNSGYGNRVMIDHGNGFITLYAHMSVVRVAVGQTVNRGDVIGDMGSTGRSTGTHLHFEIRQNGALLNPGQFLR